MQMLKFLDTIYNSRNSRKSLLAKFLDFSEGFDTINHIILLQ